MNWDSFLYGFTVGIFFATGVFMAVGVYAKRRRNRDIAEMPARRRGNRVRPSHYCIHWYKADR